MGSCREIASDESSAAWPTRMNAGKKAYPLRISADVLDALQRWADDELRSANAQIEYVLRDALRKAGRWKADDSTSTTTGKTGK